MRVSAIFISIKISVIMDTNVIIILSIIIIIILYTLVPLGFSGDISTGMNNEL